MSLEHHRARRYPFHATVELTEVQSDTHISEWTSNLSLFGCQVDTQKPLAVGTKVWIKISHGNENFDALGKVVYAQQNARMGILFTKIEANDQWILDKWIAQRRRLVPIHRLEPCRPPNENLLLPSSRGKGGTPTIDR